MQRKQDQRIPKQLHMEIPYSAKFYRKEITPTYSKAWNSCTRIFEQVFNTYLFKYRFPSII